MGCRENERFPAVFAFPQENYDLSQQIRDLFSAPIDWREDVSCPGLVPRRDS